VWFPKEKGHRKVFARKKEVEIQKKDLECSKRGRKSVNFPRIWGKGEERNLYGEKGKNVKKRLRGERTQNGENLEKPALKSSIFGSGGGKIEKRKNQLGKRKGGENGKEKRGYRCGWLGSKGGVPEIEREKLERRTRKESVRVSLSNLIKGLGYEGEFWETRRRGRRAVVSIVKRVGLKEGWKRLRTAGVIPS